MTKQRFVTLDAMRGVAALVVVALHLTARFGGHQPTFGYLSVDLFFVLSGFVLSNSYDIRLGNCSLSFWTYAAKRVHRLAPLYLLGIALGLIAQAVSPDKGMTGTHLGLSTALNSLALPSPFRSNVGNPFPLDPPFWSLFFEVWIANVAFGFLHPLLRGRTLAAIVMAGALGLTFCVARYHTLNLGWSSDLRSWLGGTSRVAFSFGAGVMLARLHRRRPIKLGVPAWTFLAVLLLLLAVPARGLLGNVYELACVLIAFPTLIFLGAEAVERSPSIGRLLGDASFSVYAVHYPLMVLASAVAIDVIRAHRTAAEVLLVVLFTSFALGAAKFDEWLRRRFPIEPADARNTPRGWSNRRGTRWSRG